MNLLTQKVLASAGLSALFVACYGCCNYLTSLRSDVPSFYFPWEQSLPFVPLLIVPYMSIDLFFVGAPFLARDKCELRTLVLRIVAAVVIACVCFLLFPLKMAFERPQVDGWLGWIFNAFRDLDLPYNEFPSLHIALCVILFDVYWRRAKKPLRLPLAAWFLLIAASPVFTRQHHVIDVLGGAALAAVCCYAFRDEPLRTPFMPNPRIAAYYGIGALLTAAVAFMIRPWSLVLLYPAASLALMALAYIWLGPGVYRKQQGRIPLSASLLLWPVRLGQHISLRYYARQCNAYDRLAEGVVIGRRLSTRECGQLPVAAVLDLTAEFSEPRSLRKGAYLQLPILDLTAPTSAQIDQAMAFIPEHAPRGTVYVHCKAGYSRTALIASTYLLATRQAATAQDALDMVRAIRPSVVIRPECIAALEAYSRKLAATLRPAEPLSPA